MFSLASSTILALALTSSVAASSNSFARLSRHHNLVARTTPPKGWATGYLENYQVYHERYTAISCENKHGTEFFDLCCHPMLATETLEKNRAACCAPGSKAQCPSTSSSSAAAPVPSAADEEDDEDCDDEEDDSGNADVDTGNAGDEDQDAEDCDDDSGNADVDTGDAGDEDQDAEDCDDEEEGDDETTSHTVARSTSSTNDDATSTIHTTPKPITTSTATTHSTAKETTVPETSTKTASTSNDNAFITGGFATWFTQNGVAGACGTKHKDTDFVVAVPTKNYAKGSNCGRHVLIVDTATGKSAKAVVADECPTCENPQCLDMSVELFKQFTTLGVGEFAIKYQYLD